MANWNKITMTDVGATLQAKINAGLTTLKFTRAAIGSGNRTGDLGSATGLVKEEMTLGINKITQSGNTVTIELTISNSGVKTGFKITEMGLFATDPDVGEVMYVALVDDNPDYMPAEGSSTVVQQEFQIQFTMSNTGNVSATINPNGFLTVAHNTDADAHAALVEQNNLYHAEATGYGIVSGCEPSISGLTVTAGAGVIHLADGTRKEIVQTNITLDAADPKNPRIDLVYIDSTGTVAKVTGTAAASPSAPTVPTGGISVAQVSVVAGSTTGTITDKRDMLRRFYNTGIVNVKDFGAVGDGVHDDTAAFRSALTAAKGGCLVVQKGNYNITSNLFANGVINVKDFGTYSDIKPVFGHKIISAKLNAAEIVTTLPVIAGSIQGLTYDSLRNQIIVGHTNNSTQYITKIDFDTLQTVSTNQFSTLGHINSLDYIANNDTVLTGNSKYLNGECTQIIGDTGFIDGAVCYDEEHKLYYLNHASRVLYMYDENKELINSIDTAAESEIVDNMFNGMIEYNGNLLVSGLGGGRIYIFDIANYLQYKGTINIGSGEFEDLFVKDNYIYGITANGELWRVAYDMPNLKRLLKEPEGVVSYNFDYTGYIEYESGLIMQWGLIQLYNLSPGYQNQKITYPIAFKHKAFFTIAHLRRGSNVDTVIGMEPTTLTSGTLFFTIPEGVKVLGCHYIAFGY